MSSSLRNRSAHGTSGVRHVPRLGTFAYHTPGGAGLAVICYTGPQIDTPGFRGMHGTAGRAAHLARALMMVALLPRGLIGGLGEDPDAISYPESKHAST